MTTLLRRPATLARFASRTSDAGLCQICISRISRQELLAANAPLRHYSSKPETREKGKTGLHRKNDGSNVVNRSHLRLGKPARGFEDLFRHGGALSSARTSAKQNNKHDAKQNTKQSANLPPGRVALSEFERQRLKEILVQVRKTFPTSSFAEVERMFQAFEKIGVPKEFREIMDKMKDGQKLDMATTWKIIKMTKDTVNQSVEEAINSTEKEETQEKDKSKEKRKSKQDEPKKSSFTIAGGLDGNAFLIACLAGYSLYKLTVPSENSREISFQEFKTTFLDKGLVEKLSVVNRSTVKVDLHREAVGRQYPESPAQHPNFRYFFTIGSVESFERKLDEAQEDLGIPSSQRIPVKYVGESAWFSTLLAFGPTIFFVGVLYWMTRRGGSGGGSSGIFSMGKSKARKFNHESDLKIKFNDVAGMDEAKQEIMEFVSFLKEPGQYQKLGAKIPRGALLSGPPGTGKTMLAKATAGESGVPFFSISGSEFVEIFVGVGASRVRDLFRTAKKSTPCIIFIDEIDAVGKSRAKSTGFGGNDEREGTLNQILTEMDGFDTSDQVVVLAGTNRPDVLDKALLRPGRFDRHISIDAPTMEGRKQIFKVHLAKITTKENIEYLTGRLAALTPGFSGADVANCVNEAALIAARTNSDAVMLKNFEQAIERVIGGLEKRSLVLNPEEKRTVAYHEAGHAICGWFFKYADPLLKVSIIPRGQGALGYAQYLPPGDAHLMNMYQLMDRMAMALGGRVSEELHFETVTSGASDDFNKVTRMATAMVTKWGMSRKLGYVYFDDSSQETSFQKPFSEHTAQEIDAEVRRIVDEALQQCRNLLQEKKKEVGLVAEELLSKEVLDRDDMVRLLGKRPFGENKEFQKYFGEDAPPPPPPVGDHPMPEPASSSPPPPPPPNPEGGVAAIRRADWEYLDEQPGSTRR